MSREKVLETSLVLSCLGICLFLFMEFKWGLWLSLFIILICFVWPSLAVLIAKGWLFFTAKIGYGLSSSLLLLVYWVAITPLSLLYRMVKGDSLQLNRIKRNTMFISRNHLVNKADFRKMW